MFLSHWVLVGGTSPCTHTKVQFPGGTVRPPEPETVWLHARCRAVHAQLTVHILTNFAFVPLAEELPLGVDAPPRVLTVAR